MEQPAQRFEHVHHYLFWQFEPDLKGPVKRYIMGDTLDTNDIAAIKAYFKSWCVWVLRLAGDVLWQLMTRIDAATGTEDLHAVVQAMLEHGGDPL